MKYLVFDTEAEAEAAQALIFSSMAVAETRNGQPVLEPVTTRWDIPRELADGRFVVISHDGTGTEWQAEWVLPEIGDGLLAGVH
jgi:hypothetical protein